MSTTDNNAPTPEVEKLEGSIVGALHEASTLTYIDCRKLYHALAPILARAFAEKDAEHERMAQSLIAILSGTEAANATSHLSVPEMMACQRVQWHREMEQRAEKAEAELAETLRLAQNCKDDMAAAERERDQLRAEVERLKLEQLRLINATSHGSANEVTASERAMQQFTVEQLHGMIADLRAQLAATEARHADAQAAIRNGLEREDALKAQLAAAEEDTKRLDWLENPLAQNWLFGTFVSGGSPQAVRRAIDKARKEVKS